MPASDTLEAEFLGLLFTNDPFDYVGDDTGLEGSTVPGNFEAALHTASPGEAGDQTTSETVYTNYVRYSGANVARSTAAWTVSGTAPTIVSNDNAIDFATGGATGATLTDFSLGSNQATVQDEMWIYGALTASLAVSSGITPSFAIGDLDVSVT